MLKRLLPIAAASILAACVSVGPTFQSGVPCEADDFSVVDDFAAARRGRCSVLDKDHVRITIVPEDRGYINDSPWYAMKVIPKSRTTARITIRYRGGHHRYIPKISLDGMHWVRLEDDAWSVSDDRKTMTLVAPASEEAFFIAAQEIITPPMYDTWIQTMVATGNAEPSRLGLSSNQAPLPMLTTNASAQDVLFLVGRQHPAEVTGAFGFFAFYETLLADTELASSFRQRFQIVAVPMLNPDGIVSGNWRHNRGGADLNRDWGPFEQPETQHIKELLDNLDSNGKRIRVFLDFHSTNRNVFYTQNEDNPTQPPLFTRTWLDNARPRVENYDFGNSENPVDKVGVAKNYMYKRYGIPSSTYEVGDETDREAIRKASAIFAEELMRLMLYNRPPPSSM